MRGQTPAAERWTPDELIKRCLAGENAAWQELLRRYERLIYSTILKADLSADDQDEAFQGSIVAIYKGLPRLRDRGRLVSWIIAIAWRQAVNCVRRQARQPRAEIGTEELGQAALEPPAGGPLPPETRLELERAQQAQEALAALPERCRRLLRYLFYEDPAPDYAEIARREGLPIGSLGPTRARCLERMLRYFEERGWTG
jgi:RNA polymerase sigma factor (sigma-70 family)